MRSRLLDVSIAVSNALCDLGSVLEDRGHALAGKRVIRLRSTFAKWSCRLLLGHPRIVFGPMCDICLDCLSIIDEHPNGRGRTALSEDRNAR